MGLELREDHIEYTHSHSASLRLLANPARGDWEQVAFIWDDAQRSLADMADRVRAIPIPELDRLEIPSDAVVARAGFEQAPLVEKLLLAHTDADGRHDFLRPIDWQKHYEPVRRWKSAAGAAEAADSQRISLDEIGRLLLHHSRSQPAPPRLALVLSSGGAKCSYQVGAVAALEEKLVELRKENPGERLDIALVVGTSGGAINSLPIALGVTTTPEGRDDFLNVWARLDQRKIVRPSAIVRANIALWFALFQTAVVAWIMRCWVKRPEMRGWVFGGLFAALACVEIIIGSLDPAPWRWLGGNHWLHHAWLWMTFGHLYDQSQSLDTRSRGKVAIFTLAPEPPHLCLFDFSDNLIRDAAEKGYRDAAGRSSAKSGKAGGGRGGSRFQKELGEPLFREISPPRD